MKINPFKSAMNNREYVSATVFNHLQKMQMHMSSIVLNNLRTLGMEADKELRLEYFFYTNSKDKAEKLATEIRKLNYSVDKNMEAGNKKLFVITGWTTKMKMSEENLKSWTRHMCELGYKCDCEFDGWGTTPNQENEK